jgi:3-oxoacyl-(acyl-carrier-protein) synthase
LFFEEYWREEPATGAPVPQTGDPLRVIFQETGAPAMRVEDICVYRAESYRQVSERIYHARPDDCSDIQRILRQVGAASDQSISIVYRWARARQSSGIHSLFSLFKAVQALEQRVSDVTLVGHYEPADLAGCWDYSWLGFARSLRLLLPDLKISFLYTNSSACTERQLQEAAHSGSALWYMDERRFVLSLRPVERCEEACESLIRHNGCYLITGGCGALGLQFARHLAHSYNARLLLVGRRSFSAHIQEQLDDLIRIGAAEAHYYAVDVGDHEALRAWAEGLPFSPSGIFHAAGIESLELFHEKSTTDIERVLRPKTAGTLLLDEIFGLRSRGAETQSLDFVCYFSSSAALLGDFGSCDYAIANRFQTAYAHYRQQSGRFAGKTVVVNWPLWRSPGQEGGMGSGSPEQAELYLKSSGQDALEQSLGIRLWHEIMRADRVQTLVMTGRPARIEQFLQRLYHADHAPALPTAVRHSPSPPHAITQVEATDVSLQERVIRELRHLVCGILQIEPRRLDSTANLADYGFDSISLAVFAKQLAGHFRLPVTPALFFNYATIRQLADHFCTSHRPHLEELYGRARSSRAELTGGVVPHGEVAPPVSSAVVSHRLFSSDGSPAVMGPVRGIDRYYEPVAIVGMSGRFPKANDVDQLWSLLAQGMSGITEIPTSRWNWRDYFTLPGHPHNRIATNQGGFIDGIDEFDPLFFEISPREAQEMDPAERLLLMEAYRAIEDARVSPAMLRGSSTGVFVGMEEGQYGLGTDWQGVTTAGAAMISSRLSYFLDLHGPTIATNTACSSGLVALHQAVSSLRHGECAAALVAGIALTLSPNAWVKMSAAGMLSQDGQCFSFAKQANGIGIGEAVVVMMLKPLSAALVSRDHIYGLIKATGINFDGKTNGVTAPNGRMQARLIESTYAAHGIDIADVSHIVAHGTGTKLGDPVEINALNDAFGKLSRRSDPGARRRARCAITSCKTNVGHTLAASGLVSLVGLLKGLQHRKIPANLHCEEDNEYINFTDSHFYINKETREWHSEGDRPRIGAVSAFGRSGTNAHVVIEEYRPPTPVSPRRADRAIVPLSARSVEQLRQKVADLLEHVQREDHIDLEAAAYTLQIAREAMEERVAFIVDSTGQLAERLQGWLSGEQPVEDSFQGSAAHRNEGVSLLNGDEDLREAIGKWMAGKKLSKLAQVWVSGVELDWDRLYDPNGSAPQRISLPTYPFARERCWIHDDVPTETDNNLDLAGRLSSIEDIINKVDAGSMETNQAVAFLRRVV